MRRLLLVLGTLFIILTNPLVALAQTSEASPSGVFQNPATNSADQKAGYDLPYPGLLPGHPLYFLKASRDKIIGMLINDPRKKAEFHLLASDKRLYAGELLIRNQNKDELGVSTISKSNNYFHQAIVSLTQTKKKGSDVKNLVEKMKASILKHKEVTSQLLKEVDSSQKRALEAELARMNQFEKSVLEISPDQEKKD